METTAATDVPFQASPETIAIMDSTATTLATILGKRKGSMGFDSCKVCYHKVTQDPEGMWSLQKARLLPKRFTAALVNYDCRAGT